MIDTLRALAIFAETVRQKSFRSAAKSLNLSPSVVSYHVTQLEKRVGTPLLYRTTRKLSLTHEGETLYAHALDMLAAAEKGFDAMSAQSSAPSGKLSIMFPSVLIQSMIHHRMVEFCRKFPRIEFHIQYTDVRQNLVEEGIDLAIHIGEMDDSSLKSRRIGILNRRLVCSPSCADRHQEPRHPRDLESWEWIGIEMLPPKRVVRRGSERFEINYSGHIFVDNVTAMTHLCLSGQGVATPPDFLVDEEILAGRLITLLPEWQVDPLPLTAVWPGNITTNNNTRRLIDSLIET